MPTVWDEEGLMPMVAPEEQTWVKVHYNQKHHRAGYHDPDEYAIWHVWPEGSWTTACNSIRKCRMGGKVVETQFVALPPSGEKMCRRCLRLAQAGEAVGQMGDVCPCPRCSYWRTKRESRKKEVEAYLAAVEEAVGEIATADLRKWLSGGQPVASVASEVIREVEGQLYSTAFAWETTGEQREKEKTGSLASALSAVWYMGKRLSERGGVLY